MRRKDVSRLYSPVNARKLVDIMTQLPTYPATPDGHLTGEMLAEFDAAGVLVLENFVTAEACAALRARVRELIDEFDPAESRHVFSANEGSQLGDRYFEESGDKIRFFFEQDAFDENGGLRRDKEASLNKMGHAMHDLDPVFDDFSRSSQMTRLVRDLGFADPVILQSMMIFKPPRIGGEVGMHQDSTFLYTEPETCIGFWFALEDATIDNGCMEFLPGGHRLGLKTRHRRGADGRLGNVVLDDEPWPRGGEVAAEARLGTLVIFHGRSPHRSAPNRSNKSRWAYTLHVIDRAAYYPEDNWLQRGPSLPLRGFDWR